MDLKENEIFLNSLNKDIKKLERKQNFKIKNLKIFSKTIRVSVPYIISSALLCFGNKVVLGYPFYKDDEIKYAEVKEIFDNQGNSSYQKKYESFNENNLLTVYYPWAFDGKNYVRNIEEYEIKDDLLNNINEIIYDENINLVDILGKPKDAYSEYKSTANLTDNNIILEVRLYNEDKNDYIIVKESIVDNVGGTIVYTVLCLISYIITYVIQRALKKDLKTYIEKINLEYSKEAIEIRNKILEIRKENYNRLVH